MWNQKVLLLSVYSGQMVMDTDEIGIASIASFLRKKNYDVTLACKYENEISNKWLSELSPDVIGIPLYLANKTAVYRICKQIKAMAPNIKICFGGAYATFYDKEILEEAPYVDYIIRGEGELVFLNLLRYLSGSIKIEEVKGLTYRQGSYEIIINEDQCLIEDLNQLPFPSRDIIVENNIKIAVISTTRGCYGNCTFCESPKYWTNNGVKKWRGRSVEKLVDEIEFINHKYKIRCYNIINTSFEDPGSNYMGVLEFAEEMLERKLDVAYSISIRAIFQRKLTQELMEKLIKSGLSAVFIGVESGNQEELKHLGKMANIEDNRRILEILLKYDIETMIGFINFTPYSTIESLRDNLFYLKSYGFASFYNILSQLMVTKGAAIYNKLNQDGLLIDTESGSDFGYQYMDKKVEELANFIQKYFFMNKKNIELLYKILFYERHFLLHLSFYKKLLDKIEHKQVYDAVLACRNRIKEIFIELNEIFEKWFSEMLSLAELMWNEKTAVKITDNMIYKQLIEYESRLSIERSKLFKKFLTSGEIYSQLLI